MSKKDFVLIANAIKNQVDVYAGENDNIAINVRYGIERVAKSLANDLQASNPRFDYRRFLEACGIKE